MKKPLVGSVAGGNTREPKLTKSEVDTQRKKASREQAQRIQVKAKELWGEQKPVIDDMNIEDLCHYINQLDPSEFRSGLITMRVNRYEYALLIYNRAKQNKRSLRELFINLIKGR